MLKFLTFAAAPNLSFDLTMLFPGASTGSLTIANTATGVTIGMSVATIAKNSTTGAMTPYTGTFSATLNNVTSAKLLKEIQANAHVVTSYSANFTPTVAAVPEATSVYLGVGGLALIGLSRWRRKVS